MLNEFPKSASGDGLLGRSLLFEIVFALPLRRSIRVPVSSVLNGTHLPLDEIDERKVLLVGDV